MTQISYIHGIGSTAVERRQRAENITERSAINFMAWTEGETRIALLAEQVKILASYYPEDRSLRKAKQILIDTLYKGLHNGGLPDGIHTGMIASIVNQIRQARQMTKPAAGKISGRGSSLAKGIGDPLIPIEECETIEIVDEFTGWTVQEWADPECPRRVQYQMILNQHLEKSSHHILYEFISNTNTVPTTAAVKAVNHKAAKETIHQITKLSKDNLRLWIRNGVIRNNAIQGAGPIHPEDTITALRDNPEGIGIAPAALVAIITAIATAISATAALVSSFKQKQPASTALWNQLQGIGTEVWGPQTGDWYLGGGGGGAGGSGGTGGGGGGAGGSGGTGGGGGTGGNAGQTGTEDQFGKILPYLLIGGGAFFLLEQ